MSTPLRNAITRLVLPLLWRHRQDHAARTLHRFGDTESDSGWQYLRAIGHTDDIALQRMLFHHVLEEYRHADLFREVATRLATRRRVAVGAARQPLVQASADMARFLAYAHACERRIHSQFHAFARACRVPEVRAVFERIGADEQGHEASALVFLKRLLGGHAGRARMMVLRARATCLHEAWLRGSRRIGDAVFGVLLSILFFSFGALLARPAAGAQGQPVHGPDAADAAAPSGAAAIATAVARRQDLG